VGYSIHAKNQAQRRGVSREFAEVIELYGEEIKSNNGCSIIRLEKKTLDEIRHDHKPLWRRYRDRCGASIVVAGDTKVTVKHQYKRLWKDY